MQVQSIKLLFPISDNQIFLLQYDELVSDFKSNEKNLSFHQHIECPFKEMQSYSLRA